MNEVEGEMRFNSLLGGTVVIALAVGGTTLSASYASRVYPLERKGVITQNFNVPWSANSSKRHTGIDIDARAGTKVYATKTGTVEAQGDLGFGNVQIRGKWVRVNWGSYLVIRDGNGISNGYLHVNPQKTYVKGARVRTGDQIGVVFDNQVPHLHYNECYQVAGCQHGAWPNNTFSEKMGAITKYYTRPVI